MSNDFIQNAVNALYQSNELMALKGELANLKAKADQSEAENARLKAQIDAKMEVGVPYADYDRLFAENARLKAEVDRLTDKVQDWEAIQNAKSGHYIGFCRTQQGLEIIGPITVIGDEVHFQSGIGNKPTHFQRYPNPPQP